MEEIVRERLKESAAIKLILVSDGRLIHSVTQLAREIINCIEKGGKLALCGNGGSATDALHFAGEVVGRFQRERCAWPAMTFNADVSVLTSIANDYGYEDVYARQAEAFLKQGDILIGISTSGNSENVLRAMQQARKMGVRTAALLGNDGGKIRECADIPIIVPGSITARVQEAHITLIHIICELAEEELCRREVETNRNGEKRASNTESKSSLFGS